MLIWIVLLTWNFTHEKRFCSAEQNCISDFGKKALLNPQFLKNGGWIYCDRVFVSNSNSSFNFRPWVFIFGTVIAYMYDLDLTSIM